MTPEILEKCNTVREQDKQMILEKLSLNIKDRIYNFRPIALDNIITKEVRANGDIVYLPKLTFASKTVHLGTYQTQDEAKLILEKAVTEKAIFNKLIKENKNLNIDELIENIKLKIRGLLILKKNIDLPIGITEIIKSKKNMYAVQLSFMSKTVCFGEYETLEEAKMILQKALSEREKYRIILKNKEISTEQCIVYMKAIVANYDPNEEIDE